jgi:MerR family transcriptional regulator, copper efflux regulator
LKAHTSSVTDTDLAGPIACSLTAGAVGDREREWCELLSQALISRTPTSNGVRVELQPLPGVCDELDRLVAAETHCCPFMTMSIETTVASLALTVTAPPLAAPIIEQLFTGVAPRLREREIWLM